MKTNRASRAHRLPRLLRWSALAVVAAGFAMWLAAGARLGWTQTSVVTLQHDEITGIEYPVRSAAFRPGVEVPILATATAALLGGAAWVTQRRTVVRA